MSPALVLIGRRDRRSNNGWMNNLPTLAKGPFRGTALLHPADAARQGLADGQQALLSSAQGSLRVQVELSDTLMPGVISLPHGWSHDPPGTRLALATERPDANPNQLMPAEERHPQASPPVACPAGPHAAGEGQVPRYSGQPPCGPARVG